MQSKIRVIANSGLSVDACYSVCLILEMIKSNVLSIQFDPSLSNWFKISDGFFQVLSGSLDSFMGSANSFSEFNSNLMDVQMKQKAFQDMYSRDEYRDIRKNEKRTWARIQNNNILNQLANSYTNSKIKMKPIFEEENQRLQKDGIEGQMMALANEKRFMQKIAQSMKVLAAKNPTYGSLSSTLAEECENLSEEVVDLTLDITETLNYPKSLNELIQEKYVPPPENLIGLGLAVAICSGVGKICSNVYGMVREKKIEEINNQKEKFEKCRSATLSLISYISSNTEKIMINKINHFIKEKRDSEWWMAVFDKLNNEYNYETLYCLYNIRYDRWAAIDPYFEGLYHSYSQGYVEGDAFSLFVGPPLSLVITEINQGLNDIYVKWKDDIFTREDLISYSRIQRVKDLIHYYIAEVFNSKGMLNNLEMRIEFESSYDEVSLYYIIYHLCEPCLGYYIGEKFIKLNFSNIKELMYSITDFPNLEDIISLYDEITNIC